MVILLVYQEDDEPSTLVIHGQQSKSWLSLASPSKQDTHQRLEITLQHILQQIESGVLPNSEAESQREQTKTS
jgi:hypothetical protein